jgi:hypothetical protein
LTPFLSFHEITMNTARAVAALVLVCLGRS